MLPVELCERIDKIATYIAIYGSKNGIWARGLINLWDRMTGWRFAEIYGIADARVIRLVRWLRFMGVVFFLG